MNITALDSRDFKMILHCWFGCEDMVHIRSVNDMVGKVLTKVGSDSIDRLAIVDRGYLDDDKQPKQLEIGSDVVTAATVAKYEPSLRRLKPKFSSRGYLHLQHPYAGRFKKLLMALSEIVGVTVYAETGNSDQMAYFTSYVKATPSAVVKIEQLPYKAPGFSSQGLW